MPGFDTVQENIIRGGQRDYLRRHPDGLDFSARLSAERAKTHSERIPRWLQNFHWLESTSVTLHVLGRRMT